MLSRLLIIQKDSLVRIHLAIQRNSLLLYPGHLYTFVNCKILPKRHTNKIVYCDCVPEHKHPFRVYTEVGYSQETNANKLTFICTFVQFRIGC